MYQEHIAGYKKLGAKRIVSQSETFVDQDKEMEDEKSVGSDHPKDTSDSSAHSSHSKESRLSGSPPKALDTALKRSINSSDDPLLLETVKEIVSQLSTQTTAMLSLADNLSDRPTAAEEKKKIPETVDSIWKNISSTSIEPDEDPKITEFSRTLLTSSRNIDINAQFNRAFRKERLHVDLSEGFMMAIAKIRLKWDNSE